MLLNFFACQNDNRCVFARLYIAVGVLAISLQLGLHEKYNHSDKGRFVETENQSMSRNCNTERQSVNRTLHHAECSQLVPVPLSLRSHTFSWNVCTCVRETSAEETA